MTSPPPSAVKRGDAVRGKLLRAAVELIGERGWTAVSTRTVAERAQVTSGLVHYHFASLQALLREAAVDTMRATLGAMRPVLTDASDPVAGLHALFAGLDQHTDDVVWLAVTESYLAATRDPELRSALAALIVEFREEVANQLDDCGHRHPAETAVVLAALIDGLLLHRIFDPRLSADTTRPAVDRLLDSRGRGTACE
ncbi:TetR family transcriptional regulator [Tamaricihabitans halophyticus]|uniref:TetR family transcriptional regulator n=1 Tax=Tamaricihabitans halophyticus TaxID=1262583 RepID=A0A4R2R225_9PSEU|nr:TetR/AcrR family transcriptional regulator [Tamaricihabitans halophyticus]TCP53521.1 TetR family transcriptional regulator [Tamaricihabitans halophyticus]